MSKSKKARVVRVKSFKELPEVVRPGTYVINGVRVEVVRSLSRDGLRMLVRGVREAESRGWA